MHTNVITRAMHFQLRYCPPCCHQAKQRLLKGEELDDVFVGQLIAEKLESSEIKHYGTFNTSAACSVVGC